MNLTQHPNQKNIEGIGIFGPLINCFIVVRELGGDITNEHFYRRADIRP
jgi:hypothetical protein